MPCHPIFSKGKLGVWACTIGREQRTPPPCYKCGSPATRLCDHRRMEGHYKTDIYGNKMKKVWVPYWNTCDRPMCDACANHVEPDTDYCDQHNNEFDIKMSTKAEKLFRKMLVEEGRE